MEKVSVSYKNSDEEVLFNEEVHYYKIPPVGRKINWHATLWVVNDIVENWDERKVEITLIEMDSSHIEKNEDKINLVSRLSERACSGLSKYLSMNYNSGVLKYSWTKEHIKSADLTELKKMPNFGVKSLKEVKQFIASL